jgi:hypothetical protein
MATNSSPILADPSWIDFVNRCSFPRQKGWSFKLSTAEGDSVLLANSSIQILDQTVTKLRAKKTKRDTSIIALNKEVADLKAENKTMSTKIDQLEETVDDLQDELDSKAKEINDLRKIIDNSYLLLIDQVSRMAPCEYISVLNCSFLLLLFVVASPIQGKPENKDDDRVVG